MGYVLPKNFVEFGRYSPSVPGVLFESMDINSSRHSLSVRAPSQIFPSLEFKTVSFL